MSSKSTNMHHLQHAADTFNELGWFLPAYITGQAIHKLVKEIDSAPVTSRLNLLEEGVCQFYTPRQLAVMYLYRYRTWPYVRDFAPLISECIEASSYGFLRAATVGLSPVVEGIALAFAKDQNVTVSTNPGEMIRGVLNHIKSRAVVGMPQGVAEEIELLIKCYRRFFDERFWKNSGHLPANETLSRHGMLHGVFTSEKYGTRYNFSRLVSVLDILCFLITIVTYPNEHLPSLAPMETDESIALANYFSYIALGRINAIRELPVRLGADGELTV